MKENLFYTVVDPETGVETKVDIEVEVKAKCGCAVYAPGPVRISGLHRGQPKSLTIDTQQLAELGHLLIALSGHDYDHDSCVELVEGYELGLRCPECHVAS